MTQWLHYLEYIWRNPKHWFKKIHMHPYIYCSAIYNSQELEATKMPISSWVDRKAVVHLHNGILLSCEEGGGEEGGLTFCNNMDGPGGYYY